MQRHLLSQSVSSTPSRPPTQCSWSGCRDGFMCCLPQRKGIGNLLLCLSLSHRSSPTPPGSEGLGELSGCASTSLCLAGGELSLDKPVCLAALRSTSRAVTDCLVDTIHVERFPCPGCLLHSWSQLQIPPALPALELGFHGECILVLHRNAQSFWEVFCPKCHSLPVTLPCSVGGGCSGVLGERCFKGLYQPMPWGQAQELCSPAQPLPQLWLRPGTWFISGQDLSLPTHLPAMPRSSSACLVPHSYNINHHKPGLSCQGCQFKPS